MQVATDYHSLYGWKLHTHQYSMTEYYHRLQEFESSPPAVFFLYDMSPILMVRRQSPGPVGCWAWLQRHAMLCCAMGSWR